MTRYARRKDNTQAAMTEQGYTAQEYRELERMWRDTRIQLTFARAEVARLRAELSAERERCRNIAQQHADYDRQATADGAQDAKFSDHTILTAESIASQIRDGTP